MNDIGDVAMYKLTKISLERNSLAAALAQAQTRIAELEAALDPFAESANGFPDDWENDVGLYLYYISEKQFEITIGHCRRARTVRHGKLAETASSDKGE